MTRVLITGIGGLVGSNFMRYVLLNTDWEVVGIDSFNHKGITEKITDLPEFKQHRQRVTIYAHDLNAPISPVMAQRIGPVDYIVNFASDSHVDRSISDPVPFVKNNINVAIHMLEYARSGGLKWERTGEFDRDDRPKTRMTGKFLQFSTDEVFGPQVKDPHGEWDPIIPSNPYSASKAAQEAIAIAYWRTYGIPMIVTNTMNIFGRYQNPEKFIPLVIKKLLNHEKIGIHSQNGIVGSRSYLHCDNVSAAIVFLLEKCEVQMYPVHNEPSRFNIVGTAEMDNLSLALQIGRIMYQYVDYELIDVHSVRPGHDLKYGLDGSKLAALGFKFPLDFDESLEETVRWYENNPEWLNV